MTDLTNEMLLGFEHMALVSCRGISVFLRYNSSLVKFHRSYGGCILDVVRMYVDLEEEVGHIKLIKDFTFSAVTENLSNGR